jgi:uncharacterized protein (DUF1810 family)
MGFRESYCPQQSVYVQRPLPEWVRAQHVLSEADCKDLRGGGRRDKWIEFYPNLEVAKSGRLATQAAYIREIRAPLADPFRLEAE